MTVQKRVRIDFTDGSCAYLDVPLDEKIDDALQRVHGHQFEAGEVEDAQFEKMVGDVPTAIALEEGDRLWFRASDAIATVTKLVWSFFRNDCVIKYAGELGKNEITASRLNEAMAVRQIIYLDKSGR